MITAKDDRDQQAKRHIYDVQTKALPLLNLRILEWTELPESIRGMKWLKQLNITGNRLAQLPAWIGELEQLQELYAGKNQLTRLPDELMNLKHLRHLDLESNQLEALPDSLSLLTKLVRLNVSDNRLADLPDVWDELIHLDYLDLSDNRIERLPESIGRIEPLKQLRLEDNRLAELPRSITQHKRLEVLTLGANHFVSIPTALAKLPRLLELTIQGNPLESAPDWLTEATHLTDLWLDPDFLPEEQAAIYRYEGWRGLKNYLQHLATAGRDVWMGKLMLVGNGNVGKTCLLDALRGKKPQEKRPTTHGMLREQMHLLPNGSLLAPETRKTHAATAEPPIDFHCWDMGGQEDYWNMHQIFFTPSALYILAYHGREDIARGRVREWLTLIRNRATARARVLLVATHAPSKDSVTQPDLASLEEDLRGMIVGFIATDSFNGDGIPELRQALVKAALDGDYFKKRLPGDWTAFEQVLSAFTQPYVKCATLKERMGQKKIKEQELLLTVAHDSGLLLWHHGTEALGEYVVLHPDWLSQAIAYVLKHQPAQKSHGLVPLKDLAKLWAEPPYKESKPYPRTVHPMLLALMEEHEISYRVSGPSGKKDEERELIAQLVDTSPTLEVKARWETPLEGASVEMARLFSFRPPTGRKPQRLTGLVYRLIVRLQDYSLGQKDHEQALHWKNGMVLENRYGDRARLEFRDDDELEIRVKGLIPVSFMDRLTDTLREVVDEFWKGVVPHEMVLCGEHCQSGLNAGAFDLQSLRADLKERMDRRRCEVAKCGKVLSVQLLLAPPVLPDVVIQLRLLLETEFKSLGAKVDAAKEMTESLGLKMSTFQQLIRDDIRAVMTNLMDDGHDGPRLFSAAIVDPDFWGKPPSIATTIKVTLWCEYSHCPLPLISKKDDAGVYTIEVTKGWLKQAGEYLKIAGKLVLFVKTLGLSGTVAGLDISPEHLKTLTEDAETVQKFLESVEPEAGAYAARFPNLLVTGMDAAGRPEFGQRLDKEGGFARWLRGQITAQEKKKDGTPSFAGMKKVNDITGKVLWIHPNFLPHFQPPAARMT